MGVAEKAHVGAVRSDPTKAASIGGKTASVDRASAAERHPTGRDRSVQSRLRRLWAALLGQAIFGFRIVLIAVAIFVFELSNNPVGLLVAAAFGLAPDRIIGPLQDQTEKLKGQLKAGKAAVETTASTATADTPGV